MEIIASGSILCRQTPVRHALSVPRPLKPQGTLYQESIILFLLNESDIIQYLAKEALVQYKH